LQNQEQEINKHDKKENGNNKNATRNTCNKMYIFWI